MCTYLLIILQVYPTYLRLKRAAPSNSLVDLDSYNNSSGAKSTERSTNTTINRDLATPQPEISFGQSKQAKVFSIFDFYCF